MGSLKILIADQIDPGGISLLKKQGYEVDEQFTITPEVLLSSISSYDALVVRSRTTVTRDVIQSGKKLQVIARAGTGVDNIDMKAAAAANISVVNARGANAEAVAEHTFAFIIMLARNMMQTTRALSEGRWEKKTYTAMELEGKTLGIVGFGAIGSRVAKFGRALGMNIVAHSRTTATEEKQRRLQDLDGTFVSLDELLKTADVVSIHVPLDVDTKHLIDTQKLQHMKKTAYLINTGRGEIIDETALISALQKGAIAGAALDVYSKEPLPADSPLIGLSNVLLTPHVASVSREGAARISMMIAEDIIRVLKGEVPQRQA